MNRTYSRPQRKFKYSPETLDEIRRHTVEIINQYVALKSAGSSMKGLCIFHDEKTPSLSVRLDPPDFHCFGCHKGGDVFSFVMEAEKVSFPRSIEIAASHAGIYLQGASAIDAQRRTKLLAEQ